MESSELTKDFSNAKPFKFCNAIYKIEDEIKNKSVDEKLKIRLEKSEPIIDNFFARAKTLQPI